MICPNPKCGRNVNPFDEKCEHCGTPLKDSPVRDYVKKADQVVNEAEKRAEEVREQIRSGFKDHDSIGKYGELRAESQTSSREKRDIIHREQTSHHYDNNVNIRGQGFVNESSDVVDLDLVFQKVFSDSASDASVDPVLLGQEKSEDIVLEAINILKIKERIAFHQNTYTKYMFDIVFANPHVVTNSEWIEKANKTKPFFAIDDQRVNAFATKLTPEQIKQVNEKYQYGVVILGGYVNFAYAVASTYSNNGGKWSFNLDQMQKVINRYFENLKDEEKIRRFRGATFSPYDLIDVLPKNTKLDAIGKFASNVVFECIAHEIGHICYGHVHGPGYRDKTDGQNIGQEHDADSFAYSLIHAAPAKKELWFALVQFMIVRAIKEILGGIRKATTHPLDTDRLKTAIDRFPDVAKEYNVNEKLVVDIIKLIIDR